MQTFDHNIVSFKRKTRQYFRRKLSIVIITSTPGILNKIQPKLYVGEIFI
jgi:hypothetical protein